MPPGLIISRLWLVRDLSVGFEHWPQNLAALFLVFLLVSEMDEPLLPFEAEIVHDLPDEMTVIIGQVMIAYAKLEHKLTSVTGLLLQLNRAEMRIVMRMPRAVDRLDMALDVFAIKDIPVKADTATIRATLVKASSGRDLLAHGLWMRHPKSGDLYLRQVRGNWPKDMTRGERVNRAVYPQSIPYSADDCRETLSLILLALDQVDALGAEVDNSLLGFPERFREPSPLLNPLGIRKTSDE